MNNIRINRLIKEVLDSSNNLVNIDINDVRDLFQEGGEILRKMGIHVESLAIIESLDDCQIKLRD